MSTDDQNGAHSSLKCFQKDRVLVQNPSSSAQADSSSSVSVLSMLNNRNQSHKNSHPLFTSSEYTASSDSFSGSKKLRVSLSPTTTSATPPHLASPEASLTPNGVQRLVGHSKNPSPTDKQEYANLKASIGVSPNSIPQDSNRPIQPNRSRSPVPGSIKTESDTKLVPPQAAYSEALEVKPGRRFRRRYNQIVRKYSCAFPGCNKSYGSLNHLNTHIVLKKHGQRKSKADFHYNDDINNNLVYHSDYSNGSYWYLPQSQYMVNQQLLANQQVPMHVPMSYQRIPPGYVVYGYPGAPPSAPGMAPHLGTASMSTNTTSAPSAQKSGENMTQSAPPSTISPSALPGTMALMSGQIPTTIPQPGPAYHHLPPAFSQPIMGPSGVAGAMPLHNASPTGAQVPMRVMPPAMPVPLDGQHGYMMRNPKAMLNRMNYADYSSAKAQASSANGNASPTVHDFHEKTKRQ